VGLRAFYVLQHQWQIVNNAINKVLFAVNVWGTIIYQLNKIDALRVALEVVN